MLSGDWIPVTLPDRVRALVPDLEVHSLGGATEASIWSITHPVGEVDPAWTSIPYGRALDGQSFHVLDESGGPCRVGETGELFIGGEGVAAGYLGDERQTRERFVEHEALGQRLYRTGDLGRWRTDGTIEFLGRVDRQVKVQGFRIELGEVEAGLARCPGVRQAVAASVPGPDARPRLVAWVVGSGLEVAVLRRQLATHLPEYMVPSRFVLSDRLPVTDNGKIDVRRLANPFERGGRELPATADRQAEDEGMSDTVVARPEVSPAPVPARGPAVPPDHPLVRLAEQVLGRTVDVHEGLAHHGVTSLEVIRLANAAEETLGRRPSVRAMMRAGSIAEWISAWDEEAPLAPPSPRAPREVGDGLPLPDLPVRVEVARPDGVRAEDLEALARWVTSIEDWATKGSARVDLEWSTDPGVIVRADVRTDPPGRRQVAPRADGEPFALTEMQLAYLVGRADDWLGAPVGPHYYTEARVADLDVARLQAALDEVVRAHPMLRARATRDARQHVLAPDDPRARIVVETHDLSTADEAALEAHVRTVREASSHRVVDPVEEPGLRLQVTVGSDGSATLHLGLDLLFVDAASAVIVVDDLRAAYEGAPVRAPAVDFAAWIDTVGASADGGSRRTAERYWRERADVLAPPPRLPVRPTGRVEVRRHEMRVDASTWARITAAAAGRAVTPTALLLGALGVVLASVDGEESTVVTTVFDRPEDHAGVVGDYTSTVLTALPAPGGRLVDLVTVIHERMWSDLEHSLGASGVHGNEVLRMVAERGGERRFPVAYSSGIGSTVGSDGTPRDAGRLLDGWGETTFAVSQTPHVVVDVQSFEVGGGLVVRWDAVDEVLPDGWVDTAFDAFCRIVRSAAEPAGWEEAPPHVALPTGQVGGGVRPAPTTVTCGGSAETVGLVLATLEEQVGTTLGEGDSDASFFDLGATSVSLLAVHRNLTEAGYPLSVVDLFAHPTPRRLAAFLESESGTGIGTEGEGREPGARACRTVPERPVTAAQDWTTGASARGARRRAAREAAARLAR